MVEQVTDPGQQVSQPVASAGPWDRLDAFRSEMRRFAETFAELPVSTQATCPVCQQVRPSVFQRSDGQVVLSFDCPDCNRPSVVHHDAIWTDLPGDVPGSATRTFHGSRVRPVIRRLPRTVETLCPECSSIIIGRHFVRDGQVWTEKTCPEHGYFCDRISSDVQLYSKALWWSFEEHAGQQYPQITGAKHCPSDCGLCNQHLSSPCLAQIDLTNRCNMKCPICFANANAQGFTWEPDYDEIVRQMRVLREMKPTSATAIQFTGGEPTIHPDFLRIVTAASEMGFSHIQIATNGIKMADEDFARKARDAGLHTLYLQFDGVGEEPYRRTRNYPGIWQKKLAAIDNARKTGMKVCLVPMIVKTVNDDQVPEILQFAIDNIDVISGISWQPVSFTGRTDTEEIDKYRYTLGDLALDLGRYPGVEPMRDMFPLSLVVPLSNLLEAITGDPKVRPSCHPDCAFGTYFLVSPEGKAYPFPTVIDVEGMFCDMNRHAKRIKARRRKANRLDKLRLYFMLKRHWRKDTAPPDLSVRRFIRTLMGMVDKGVGRGKSGRKNYRSLLCAGMHFQDRYNYDVERVKRCVILYSTPAGVFPFCSHNCGPEFRHLSQAGFLNLQKQNNAEAQ
jgi:hypothetical protein